MRTIKLENGKTVELSDESYKNLEEAVQSPKDYNEVAEKLFIDKESYFISNGGNIFANNNGFSIEANKNVALSKKQLEKLLAINKLMNVAKYLNDGWVPDWNNNHEHKYYILINKISKDKIVIEEIYRIISNNVYFKSLQLAEQAVEILGEDVIRLSFCTDY